MRTYFDEHRQRCCQIIEMVAPFRRKDHECIAALLDSGIDLGGE